MTVPLDEGRCQDPHPAAGTELPTLSKLTLQHPIASELGQIHPTSLTSFDQVGKLRPRVGRKLVEGQEAEPHLPSSAVKSVDFALSSEQTVRVPGAGWGSGGEEDSGLQESKRVT